MGKTAVVIVIVAVLGYLPLSTCWNRADKTRSFDGAVLFRRNSALQTDILKKIITFGEIQCGQACLSENNCVARTFCVAWGSGEKGTCYLHKNGIQEERIGNLVRKEKCTYQQYINFYVSTLDIYL